MAPVRAELLGMAGVARYGFQKVLERILRVDYHIPKYPRISSECKDLITRILVADPDRRLTITQIQRHPWYSKGLPPNVIKMNDDCLRLQPHDHPGYQTIPEIKVSALFPVYSCGLATSGSTAHLPCAPQTSFSTI